VLIKASLDLVWTMSEMTTCRTGPQLGSAAASQVWQDSQKTRCAQGVKCVSSFRLWHLT